MDSSKKYILFVLLSFILGLIIGYGVSNFYKNRIKDNQIASKSTNDLSKSDSIKIDEKNFQWTKPLSTKKGFPIFNSETNVLSIFLIDSKEMKETEKKPLWGGGAAGLGVSDSTPSPDLLYTVYIDKDTRGLKLLSNETFKETDISLPGEKVSYISGWSPDSKKIIYDVGNQTLATRKEGMMPWEGIEKFPEDVTPGYILFNIETGKRKSLYPVGYFESFIDESRILVKAGDDEFMGKKYIVFNIDTFEADYSYVKEEFGYGASQYTFSQDGSKWTYTLSRNPTEDANIILADFPNKEQIEVDKGGWADVQFPFISPTGTKIAYWKKEGYISDGVPRFTVWIYDTINKSKEKFVDGMVTRWIDDNTLIYRVQHKSVIDSTYYLLDLSTRKSLEMK
jgi:hypothetical protein